MATDIQQYHIGNNRGNKRIWLQGRVLEDHGFVAGTRYNRSATDGRVTLILAADGRYVVSGRKRSGSITPIIDMESRDISENFEGCDAVKLVYKGGSIVISQSDLDARIKSREQRFVRTVNAGKPLNCASLYMGGGILDAGLHEGFKLSDLPAQVKVAVEIESKYLDSSVRNNDFWAPDALRLNSPMELMLFGSSAPEGIHVLSGGVPCTGASRGGRSKNKIQFAEDHEKAGAQIFYTLQWVANLHPSLCIFENVIEYASTASWSIAKGVLDNLGYVICYREFSGAEFGALEDRKRMVAVAVSKGLHAALEFNIDAVMPRKTKPAVLADVLEVVSEDSDVWGQCSYLVAKQSRDLVDGKGFRLQWLDAEIAETVGCIGRGYFKRRSTEPMVKHPTRNGFVRLLTPAEHAACKTIPIKLIDGIDSLSIVHEIIGQSVVYEWFACLGTYIGRWTKAAASIYTGRMPRPEFTQKESANQPQAEMAL